RIVQSRDGEELSLDTQWPESEMGRPYRWRSGGERMRSPRCRECKITAQYEIVVPPGVHALLHTVNGDVRADRLDGELDAQSVNGGVRVQGARQSVSAGSVNGKVELTLATLPAAASIQAKTVNGAVLVALPKESKFELSASTMNGTIASTFPLPALAETEGDDPASRRGPAMNRVHPHHRAVVVEKDGEDTVVDLKEIEKEIEESMKEVESAVREAQREVRRLHIVAPGNAYKGSIGQGGARLRLSTLNGSITLLAAGTSESEAKPLVSPRRSFTVEVPRVQVRVSPVIVPRPAAPAAPVAPVIAPRPIVRVAPALAGDEDFSVVRGDVTGDFLATAGGGGYKLGRVSGRVKIVTNSGEIHVGSAGAGAELKTSGGDITVGPVSGDLRAHTDAGDVRAGAVGGAAVVETSGGDVRIERIGGVADLRTGGGDIVVQAVGGGFQARTDGGDVRVAVLSREPRGGISIRNGGGDVTLTLPADVRAELDLQVTGCSDPSEAFIRSDFPEIAVTRKSGESRGSGSLNGGGPRIVIRTSSGTIRLRKGGPTGN
ncbi:MAG TPA: DUF4097 family beta strand repeat-containing protein, partial [Thermoanaerobaculia bacterium]|nr:DUF4097 family beta strand repeat-containing protein [Thermoanaerobaculia bacterium]